MSDIRTLVHASYDDLVRYVQGRLGPEGLSAIDLHLSDCDVCRERLFRNIGSQITLHLVGKAKADQRRERSEPRFSTGSEAIVQSLNPLFLERHTVRIVDISKNGLGILASEAALPGTIMRVRINTAVELAEVRHCSACGVDGYRIGLRFIAVSDEREPIALSHGAIVGDLQIPPVQQPDRRQAPRQQLSRAVAVTVLGTGQLLQGEIRNFSQGGAQILLDRQLRVASPIKIEYAGKLLLGEVVYCRQERANWLLGIRVGNELSGVIALADAMGSQ